MHARISADNLAIYEHVTTTVERGELTDARPGGLIRGPRKVRRDKSMR